MVIPGSSEAEVSALLLKMNEIFPKTKKKKKQKYALKRPSLKFQPTSTQRAH